MKRYLDTSVIVAVLTREARTGDVQNWLKQQKSNELLVSDWGVTEVSSALSIKLRTGQIGVADRSAALAFFAGLTSQSLSVVSVSRTHFREAARFSDQYELGLRAGDSLHLAIAADHGATIDTLDRRLAAAGTKLGVRTNLI